MPYGCSPLQTLPNAPSAMIEGHWCMHVLAVPCGACLGFALGPERPHPCSPSPWPLIPLTSWRQLLPRLLCCKQLPLSMHGPFCEACAASSAPPANCLSAAFVPMHADQQVNLLSCPACSSACCPGCQLEPKHAHMAPALRSWLMVSRNQDGRVLPSRVN